MALVDTSGLSWTLKQYEGCDTNWLREKIYRYCCTIKPTQTCPLWHTAEGGHLHILIPKTTKQPKLPAPRLSVPADEQTVACQHVHRGAGFPSKCVVQLLLAVGRTAWPSSTTMQDLGGGWMSHGLTLHSGTSEILLGLRPGFSHGAEGAG